MIVDIHGFLLKCVFFDTVYGDFTGGTPPLHGYALMKKASRAMAPNFACGETAKRRRCRHLLRGVGGDAEHSYAPLISHQVL